ncbi:MAG: AAA family ATPase, partial [Acidimicrobiales bacterium]
MRPRRLEFSAFGPYAGDEVVDFDALSDFGLFVVSGPTGSGKSSIFNALCFALYGVFPGEFSGDRYVRSQHAAAETPCVVSLEFQAGGEQWKVTRRTAFERPKKRGEGTRTVAAEATLARYEHDEWSVKSSKIAAVNDRCEELVGLDSEQFQRVVLLPQGGFARVLNASVNDRRMLLRKLFSSSRFDRTVE